MVAILKYKRKRRMCDVLEGCGCGGRGEGGGVFLYEWGKDVQHNRMFNPEAPGRKGWWMLD